MASTSSPSTLGCLTRHTPRLIAASLVLAIAYVAATLMQKVLTLGPVAALAVALLPAAGCVFFLFEEVRVMRSLDELHRLESEIRHVESDDSPTQLPGPLADLEERCDDRFADGIRAGEFTDNLRRPRRRHADVLN